MAITLNEHLGYLSLPNRHELYRRAVAQAVKPGDVVADLGCGFGVLGLLCLQNGASKIYGIDSSQAIHIARETAQRAGFGERYHCVEASTYEARLPEKVDVLICDHIGWFGLDYDIAGMLADAKARFLKPGGVIIPQSLELLVAGVSSQDCADLVDGWMHEPVPAEFHWLRGHSANAKHGHTFARDELITRPESFASMALGETAPEHLRFEAELTAIQDATFHGVAGWFDAQLWGDIRMTNSPLSDRSIERCQAFLPAENPFPIKGGEQVKVALQWRPAEHMMAWTFQPPGDAAAQKMSTWNSAILAPADLAIQNQQPAILTQRAAARQCVLAYVDGLRSVTEIEQIVLENHPDLMPSASALREFVRRVLKRDTKV